MCCSVDPSPWRKEAGESVNTASYFFLRAEKVLLSSVKMGTLAGHLSSSCCKDIQREDMDPLGRTLVTTRTWRGYSGDSQHRYFGVSDLF